MCQILKMPYVNGSITVEVSSVRELTSCIFELYLFDFASGEYSKKANIRQPINSSHLLPDSGIYNFKYPLPDNCKVKCVISDGEKVLASKERFIGERRKIVVERENSDIGILYKIKSEFSVSKKLIFYKSPVSATKINIPDDIKTGETLMFTIKERGFDPKFEVYPEFSECFNIEG